MNRFAIRGILRKFVFGIIFFVVLCFGLFKIQKQAFAQSLTFPAFKLPYSSSETIYWSGGPHGYNEGGILDGKYSSGDGSGLDFSNGSNFEVLAMADGVVVDSGCNNQRPFGCQIAVVHDVGGTVLVYAHLLSGSLNFSKGQHVKRGDILAKAGSTGTGGRGATHLHVELRDGLKDSRGRWICTRECINSPQNLGGNPVGWDGLKLTAGLDGYYIVGYCVVQGEPCTGPNSFYNYDGSAVKSGLQQVINSFPYHDYIDSTRYATRSAIVSVDLNFVCTNTDNCEINMPGAPTQFAGNGVIPGSTAFSSGTMTMALASTSPYGGTLISTNSPPTLSSPTTWSRTYGGRSDTRFESFIETDSKGFLAVGYSNSGTGSSNGLVINVDGSGNILWQKIYGDVGSLNSVAKNTDGTFIIGGQSNNYPWVLKIDSGGNIIWEKLINLGNSFGGYINSIVASPDGGYVFTVFPTSPSVPESDNGWIFKLDGAGNVLWYRSFGSYGRDRFDSVVSTQDGGYIAAGMATANSGWLMKLDNSGNKVWEKIYMSANNLNSEFTNIVLSNDGNIVVTGITDLGDWPVGPAGKMWILKVNMNGDIIWNKAYSAQSYGGKIVNSADGGYFILGDIVPILMKLDSLGNIVWQKEINISTLHSIVTTSDGQLVLAGYILGANTNALIIKLDPNKDPTTSCLITLSPSSYVDLGTVTTTNSILSATEILSLAYPANMNRVAKSQLKTSLNCSL